MYALRVCLQTPQPVQRPVVRCNPSGFGVMLHAPHLARGKQHHANGPRATAGPANFSAGVSCGSRRRAARCLRLCVPRLQRAQPIRRCGGRQIPQHCSALRRQRAAAGPPAVRAELTTMIRTQAEAAAAVGRERELQSVQWAWEGRSLVPLAATCAVGSGAHRRRHQPGRQRCCWCQSWVRRACMAAAVGCPRRKTLSRPLSLGFVNPKAEAEALEDPHTHTQQHTRPRGRGRGTPCCCHVRARCSGLSGIQCRPTQPELVPFSLQPWICRTRGWWCHQPLPPIKAASTR